MPNFSNINRVIESSPFDNFCVEDHDIISLTSLGNDNVLLEVNH